MNSESAPKVDSQRLFSAISKVLQEDFQFEVESYLDDDSFGADTKGSLAHRFEEWVVHLVREDGDLEKLVSTMGIRTGSLVLQALGAADSSQRFKRSEILRELNRALGIPDLHINGHTFYSEVLECCREDLDQEQADDNSVASRLRQHTERLLREVALLANACGLTETFKHCLMPESRIRVPSGTPQDEASLSQEVVEGLLLNDHWGDLGLLAILVGKAGKAVRCGRYPGAVEPLTKAEATTLNALAKVLQDYAHFKPSHHSERQRKLRETLDSLLKCVRDMQDRGAIPRAAVLLTRTSGYFGQTYGGRDSSGHWVSLRSNQDLPLGVRILFREVSNPVHRIAGWVRVDQWT